MHCTRPNTSGSARVETEEAEVCIVEWHDIHRRQTVSPLLCSNCELRDSAGTFAFFRSVLPYILKGGRHAIWILAESSEMGGTDGVAGDVYLAHSRQPVRLL